MQTNCFVRGARDTESRQRQNFEQLCWPALSLYFSSHDATGLRGWLGGSSVGVWTGSARENGGYDEDQRSYKTESEWGAFEQFS